jgi:predicted RNA binding protein YcfA (HicA-like mRNA interferase family)
MPKLPRVSGKEMVRVLERRGFFVARVKGSHHILKHSERPELRVVVAVHGNDPLPMGTLRSILYQADLSPDELRELI